MLEAAILAPAARPPSRRRRRQTRARHGTRSADILLFTPTLSSPAGPAREAASPVFLPPLALLYREWAGVGARPVRMREVSIPSPHLCPKVCGAVRARARFVEGRRL